MMAAFLMRVASAGSVATLLPVTLVDLDSYLIDTLRKRYEVQYLHGVHLSGRYMTIKGQVKQVFCPELAYVPANYSVDVGVDISEGDSSFGTSSSASAGCCKPALIAIMNPMTGKSI
jgi:hypothetical protein